MKLKEIYSKPIERAVNPAVSATKFDEETKRVEIQEYVFTDEIMNGLFRILDAIKNNRPYDHVGIWIDGYYGSGKSHFLKYLDYCITPGTQEAALNRFTETVKSIDPMDDTHSLQFDYKEIESIANWLKRATIDTCIFNLETSYDNSTDKKKAFLHVFWNEFNGKRGFNKFNITMAQHLEKPLAEKGVFEAFKKRIAEEGGDWSDPGMAADMIDNELSLVLDIATELAPSLDKESIRERIIKRDTNMSIERFGGELAAYLKDKGDDYRLILLADEVSQFINKERDRYLNLQEIITKLSESCGNKVWVACTAQQDLSEIMDDCHIVEEKDKEGKIKGRFEVKVSLKGTQPEVITQKRILDKKEEVIDDLGDLYNQTKASFDLQFKLPATYKGYESKEDFIAYYPFVPYQFKLIMQVFNSFLNLGYVAKEVKGNERSIIKVIHSTAKANMDAELGKFISFDELYNNMFEEGLQARGQRAVNNAIEMARAYSANPRLATRVANVLFMICNISQTDQLVFPATLDNITSLLVNDVDTPRLNIKNDVEKVIDYLCDNNIIRREQSKQGAPETYQFYSEEEMRVATLIKTQQVDTNTQAEQLKDIFFKHFSNLRNKEQYKTRSFSVGVTIKQRFFLTTNNPDVQIEFAMDADWDNADQLALQNGAQNRLIFYIAPQFQANKRLFNNFYWFCQVQRYMATPVMNEDNANTRKEFQKRAAEVLSSHIIPEFQKILDSCPVISGMAVIDNSELSAKYGTQRYEAAIQKHLSSIYTDAVLVDNPQIPRTTDGLRKAILRPVNPGDYDGLGAEMTTAEKRVENYLSKQFGEVNVSEVLAKFAKAPFGWDNICTLYVINELVRRHRRDYSYANNPNVEPVTVANKIAGESNKFTLREATAISQDILNRFMESWKDIFGVTEVFSTNDSAQLFRMCREDGNERSLTKRRDAYNRLVNNHAQYPFIAPIREMTALFDEWMTERDPEKFFNAVINDREKAHALMDTCKEVSQFINDQLPNYISIRNFVQENKENFRIMPNELQTEVEAISKIETAAWPIRIRDYMKMRTNLTSALEEVKKELREKITKAYNDAYELLERGCEAANVDKSVLSNKEATIKVKTSPQNILALQNNLNTDGFYAEQAERIQRAKKPAKPYPVGTDNGIENKVAEPNVKNMSLQTRTITPLYVESDVDAYLAKLKEQLMKQIKEGHSVMIIK
jgi:predicted transcriptional regulator